MAKLTPFEQEAVERFKEAIELNKEKIGLGNVDIEKARDLIKDAGAVVLDVTLPNLVEGENAEEAGIPTAYYTPYTEFTDYIDELPEDKTQPILVVCRKAFFANRVKGLLDVLGYKNVYVLADDVKYLVEAHKAHTEG
ncbi:rhodanese-like domain-containing protein [Lebetimonas sp. JH292]|uniref:rhodanese-like domain-containing protein n=1 Tax=Lebetimonas sp. JH292 TaxID=990068 RepID=UPI00046571C2|nr:rhodanese-like domain-containing protein [Lebetimonas sp. JH292]